MSDPRTIRNPSAQPLWAHRRRGRRSEWLPVCGLCGDEFPNEAAYWEHYTNHPQREGISDD